MLHIGFAAIEMPYKAQHAFKTDKFHDLANSNHSDAALDDNTGNKEGSFATTARLERLAPVARITNGPPRPSRRRIPDDNVLHSSERFVPGKSSAHQMVSRSPFERHEDAAHAESSDQLTTCKATISNRYLKSISE